MRQSRVVPSLRPSVVGFRAQQWQAQAYTDAVTRGRELITRSVLSAAVRRPLAGRVRTAPCTSICVGCRARFEFDGVDASPTPGAPVPHSLTLKALKTYENHGPTFQNFLCIFYHCTYPRTYHRYAPDVCSTDCTSRYWPKLEQRVQLVTRSCVLKCVFST